MKKRDENDDMRRNTEAAAVGLHCVNRTLLCMLYMHCICICDSNLDSQLRTSTAREENERRRRKKGVKRDNLLVCVYLLHILHFCSYIDAPQYIVAYIL